MADYSSAQLILESINTDLITTQGTNIGAAIDLAIESFGKDEGKNKAIIVITDGENHEEDAIIATENAAEKNITVHTIGMGSIKGAPIPIYKGNIQAGYRQDKNGTKIVTKLNEPMLQQIATSGNGIYVRANNYDVGLKNVLKAIDELEKKDFESKMFIEYEDLFQWFIAAGLLFILLETITTERKSKLYKKLNLFNEPNAK